MKSIWRIFLIVFIPLLIIAAALAIFNLTQQTQTLQAQLAESRQHSADLQTQLDTAKAQLPALQSQLKDLQAQIDALTKQLKDAGIKIAPTALSPAAP